MGVIKYKDVIGLSKNRLTILKELEPKIVGKQKWRMIECKCSCGNITIIKLVAFTTEHTKSCGCLHNEANNKRLKKFNINVGDSNNPFYSLFIGIMDRCYNTKNKSYHRYGGRGITVCKEWIDKPQLFFDWCLNTGWKEGLQIDREDNDKGYFPENCRFTTPKINSNNREEHNIVELNGQKMTLSQAYDILKPKVSYKAFKNRYMDYGYSLQEAATINKRAKYGR